MRRLSVAFVALMVVAMGLSCSTAWAGRIYVGPAPVVVYHPGTPVVTYYAPAVPVVTPAPVVTPPVVTSAPVVTPTPVVTPEAVVYPATVVYPAPAVIRTRVLYGPRRAVYRVIVP